MSNGNERDLNFHYDYAMSYEDGFGRYLTSFDGLHSGDSTPARHSPSPTPRGRYRPWSPELHEGPQTLAPYPTIPPNPPRLNNPIQYYPAPAPPQPQPVGLQAPVHNVVPPPPPFVHASGHGASSLSAFSGSPNLSNQVPAQSEAFAAAYSGMMAPLQGHQNATAANATTAPQHGFHHDAATAVIPHRPAPAGATPANSRRPALAAAAAPAAGPTALRRPAPAANTGTVDFPTASTTTISLDQGFKWNKKSLALLAMSKLKRKKGWEYVAEKDIFPGKSGANLRATWQSRKDEARAAYTELSGVPC